MARARGVAHTAAADFIVARVTSHRAGPDSASRGSHCLLRERRNLLRESICHLRESTCRLRASICRSLESICACGSRLVRCGNRCAGSASPSAGCTRCVDDARRHAFIAGAYRSAASGSGAVAGADLRIARVSAPGAGTGFPVSEPAREVRGPFFVSFSPPPRLFAS